MELGFNKVANDDRGAAVSIDALRGQALKRLAGVQNSMESKGLGGEFSRSAKVDPIGDMGLLGTVVMGMIMGGPISAVLHAHFPVLESFNYAAVSPFIDGISFLRDQETEGYRSRKLSDYPEGRKKCALEAARTGKKFNLVSGTQKHRFSFDAKAEMACMYEIIDMLDRLEDEGVKMMRLDQDQPVYEVLKQNSGKMFGNGALRTHDMPMMMAV
jgi:hypothetical protein